MHIDWVLVAALISVTAAVQRSLTLSPASDNTSAENRGSKQEAPNTADADDEESEEDYVEMKYEGSHHLRGKSVNHGIVNMASASSNYSLDSESELEQTYKWNGRLLLFWAVNSNPNTIDLVKENVKHARSQVKNVDVYLVHYDQKQNLWKRRVGEAWYRKNVQHSSQVKGYKMKLMVKLLAGHWNIMNLKKYSWVWTLDEDVDFRRAPLRTMLTLADASHSWIAMPAFTETARTADPQPMSFPFQLPHRECEFRHVPMIEGIFPLLRPQVIHELSTCEHCMHDHSVWGLCRMWCGWSAKQFGTSRKTACAILDATPVVHRNFLSLSGKYTAGQIDWKFQAQANQDMQDVKDHFPKEFVSTAPAYPWEWQCMVKHKHKKR